MTVAPPSVAAQVFASREPEYVFADPERRRKIAATFPAIDALVDAEVREHGLTGIAVGVVVDGELAHVRGAGVASLETKAQPDADTVFRIGSITKSFTSLAVLALRDDGALSLDDPLTHFLPEAAGLVYPTRDAAPITLRELLTHTAGLPRLGDFNYTLADREPSEEEITRSLSGFALDSAPGTRSSYSNLGFALLGITVGRAAHQPFRAFVAKRIFEPLGMTSTAFDPAGLPPARVATGYEKSLLGPRPASQWRLGASEGAGGIYSTVRDMARYVAFQLQAYPPRSAPEAGPVRRSSVREAHFNALRQGKMRVRLRDGAAKGESAVEARAVSYGYAWVNEETCELDEMVWHNGGVAGFSAATGFLPQRGVGIVALSNFSSNELDLKPLAEKALLALKKGGGLAPRIRHEVLPPAFAPAMARFLAVYNAWDEAAYKAMLSTERPAIKPEDEHRELLGYFGLHGACKGYEAVEILGLHGARLSLSCERGALEMAVALDAKGLITGFGGTSREVPPPPATARAADRIAGLIRKWDEPTYKKILGANKNKTHAERQAFFEEVRKAHGSCAVKGYERTDKTQALTLTCDRGGDLRLELALDAKNEDAVTSFSLNTRGSGGACPVR